MDLFNPIVDASRFHPTFANVKNLGSQLTEEVIQQWSEGFIDRDGNNKFVTEFQTTFNSSFWELYLHATLKSLGCVIDFSFDRPDFCVTEPFPFCVEATVALHAKGGEPASTLPLEVPEDFADFNRQSILRLSNSISTKSAKYVQEYSSLKHVQNLPFVIAVAPFDRPLFGLQVNRAIEACLFGYYVDEFHGSREDVIRFGPQKLQIDAVVKDNGKDIKVGFFNDDSHSHISAVIFSSCATWGKASALSKDPYPYIVYDALHYNPTGVLPYYSRRSKADYREHLLDGLRVYHNPFAKVPLRPSLFSDERIFQTYFNHSSDEWQYQMSSKNLLFRFSTRFMTQGDE